MRVPPETDPALSGFECAHSREHFFEQRRALMRRVFFQYVLRVVRHARRFAVSGRGPLKRDLYVRRGFQSVRDKLTALMILLYGKNIIIFICRCV
jgi:hypothetical protein